MPKRCAGSLGSVIWPSASAAQRNRALAITRVKMRDGVYLPFCREPLARLDDMFSHAYL
jgi:hypothetical protein